MSGITQQALVCPRRVLKSSLKIVLFSVFCRLFFTFSICAFTLFHCSRQIIGQVYCQQEKEFAHSAVADVLPLPYIKWRVAIAPFCCSETEFPNEFHTVY